MQPYVEALSRRGVEASAVQLPRGSAERAVDAYARAVERAGAPPAEAVIGGHSFGGRVASLLAAAERPAGLVLLSYPLHRPGRPDERRTDHWPQIGCPVLLLSGDADPFARIELLRDAAALLAEPRLVVYARRRHGLLSVADEAATEIAAFVAGLRSSD